MEPEENDPMVQYFVVKESLGMSPGKLGAQVAHAEMLFMLEVYTWAVPDVQPPKYKTVEEWLKTSYTKILLGASDNEFEKAKTDEIQHVVVVDLGRTEIAAGSETVIGFWPMRKSARSRSKALKRLRLL
jgi:PTH2 family peptidyl-tRNA hydrolase